MPQKTLIDHSHSVKRSDFGSNATDGVFSFWLPYDKNDLSSLPPTLPPPVLDYMGMLPNERDKILLSTMYFESFWAGAVGIEASKFASAGWSLKSDKPRVQERIQNILLNSTVGVLSGWVPFACAGFSSFANCGKWIIEVERYTKNRNSRIKALHHLSPSRCWLTTDPQKPIVYLDRKGVYHELRDHQVMIFFDMPDPGENTQNSPISSAVRAYDSILQLSALKLFLYEKMTGRRPLAFNFLQGISDGTLSKLIANAQNAADAENIRSYMGSVMSAVLGDTPLNLITVPLAEIPDGVDVDQIRKYAHLEYANALGDDPTRFDPQLIGNRQLGGGTQAKILDTKARQGGAIVMLKQNLTHSIMQLIRSEKIDFAFEEVDLQDESLQAQNSKTRAETRKIQIESGEIDTQQAANLAVDHGDLPQEFIPKDETDRDVLTDAEQPTDKIDMVEKETIEDNDQPEMTTQKQIDPDDPDEIARLIESQYKSAQEIYKRLSEGK